MPSANPIHAQTFDLVTVIGVDPGAGNDFSYPVPANSRIEAIYIGFIFSTDANAANRYTIISGATPTLNQQMGASAIAQTAGLTWGQGHVAGLPQEVDLSAQNITLTPMSPNLILEPGDALEANILNIQAGDAIASIIIRYKQWIIA